MLKSHKNLACLEVLEYQIWELEQQVITTEKKKKPNPNEFVEEFISGSAEF